VQLLVDPLPGLLDQILAPGLLRERGEGQQLGRVREPLGELVDDPGVVAAAGSLS
jgi:hypothetical protein